MLENKKLKKTQIIIFNFYKLRMHLSVLEIWIVIWEPALRMIGVTGESEEEEVKTNHLTYDTMTITFEPRQIRHENQSCSACIKDQ